MLSTMIESERSRRATASVEAHVRGFFTGHVITVDDYDLWRANFGRTLVAAAVAVPHPRAATDPASLPSLVAMDVSATATTASDSVPTEACPQLSYLIVNTLLLEQIEILPAMECLSITERRESGSAKGY